MKNFTSLALLAGIMATANAASLRGHVAGMARSLATSTLPDETYAATFQRTGCPVARGYGTESRWWRRQSDARVWTDMWKFCALVQRGRARKHQVDFCCGNGQTCKPAKCIKQKAWSTAVDASPIARTTPAPTPAPTPVQTAAQTSVPAAVEGGAWKLVFRQTFPFKYSPANNWEQARRYRADDPTGDNYSVLDELEQYRCPSDDKLHLKYVLPGVAGANEWKQTSNPVSSGVGVQGYEPVSISWGGYKWFGLESRKRQAFLDGSAGGWWFYPVGAKQTWKGGYPGASGHKVAKQMELWAFVEDKGSYEAGGDTTAPTPATVNPTPAPATPKPTQPMPTPKPTPTPTPTPKPTPVAVPPPTGGLKPLDAIRARNEAKFAAGSTIPLVAKKPQGMGLAKACCEDPTITRTVNWSEWTEGRAAAAAGEVVTVPCGTHVVLDAEPESDLKGLRIEGKLSVLNDAQFAAEVRTGYVFNCGELEVGTADDLFAGELTVTLIGAEELEGFGYKAFATSGGLTRLHGRQCGGTVWTTLRASAPRGSDRLALAEPVVWREGDEVVVAATGYKAAETERRTLKALEDGGKTAVLDAPLRYNHGGVAPITAEVASLSRNIVIRGEDSCKDRDNALSKEAGKCGHFVINHTPLAHRVCSVEITNMGQSFTTGRYPLHLHFLGSAPEVEIKSNAVHDNHQRGIVVHATSDTLVEENVVMYSKGHLLMTEDSLEEGNKFVRNVLGMNTFRSPRKMVGRLNAKCAYLVREDGRGPARALDKSKGEWGYCEWHRCSHGTGVYADVCGSRHDDHVGTAAIWMSNPANLLEGNRVFVTGVDAAIRLENRGVTGLSAALPKYVQTSALDSSYRSTNFKSKPQGPKGGIRANVVHSSPMGLKNYPHWTPRGGVLIEDHVAFHNTVGIMCKNGYSYTNDSPYFEDGKDGRTSQRYTVRGATLIGNIAAVHTINGPTKMHVERSVIATKPPADLYPAAAADAIAGQEQPSGRRTFLLGIEGKHLPRDQDTWAITIDDETMAVARANGFRTRPELEKTGIKFNLYGGPNGKHRPISKNVAFLGNVNQFYQRALCGNRGKAGPACYRPAFDFPKPAPAAEDEVEDIEEELKATTDF